jgi:hypothetical protein
MSTPPTYSAQPTDLCQLADVKAWLSIAASDTTFDNLLQRLLSACSMTMQAYMNRLLNQNTYTYTFNGNGKPWIMLLNYPIQSVTSVMIDGQSVLPGAPADEFGAQTDGFYNDDDTVYLRNTLFRRGVQNCQIEYVGGLPGNDPNLMALAQACIEQVSLRFKERSRIGERTKVVNGENITFFIGQFPPSVVQLMDNLKNVVPV